MTPALRIEYGTARTALGVACTVAAVMLIADAALAQTPFGARAATEAQGSGLVGWLIEMQSTFYRQISTTLRAAR